jgi:hypothetical protein
MCSAPRDVGWAVRGSWLSSTNLGTEPRHSHGGMAFNSERVFAYSCLDDGNLKDEQVETNSSATSANPAEPNW